MASLWDAKNNFILLHNVNLYQQQSLTSHIDWSSIVSDIQLEISSTPVLLQNQYEHLLKNFHPGKDSKSLHSTLKHIYLHGLCQRIEDDSKFTLETVYELIRHIRAKRIDRNDVEQLITDWNSNYSSDEQKTNKERLVSILNRLRDYCCNSPSISFHHHSSEHLNINGSSAVVPKEIDEEEMETVSESDDENSEANKPHELMNIDSLPLISNLNKQEKSSLTRRRTQSLSLVGENQDNKVNVGVEWFVPKLKRQQRSSSLHARSQSPTSIDPSSIQNQTFSTNRILMTTIDDDESSHSTADSNPRQNQPAISWVPLTDEHIVEKEHQKTKSKLIDEQDLEAVSSTDSDSIEVQWQTFSKTKTPRSPSSHDLNQQDSSSSKRQRISEEN